MGRAPILLLAAAICLWTQNAEAVASEPTAAEQLFIYLLNRARHDPPGWAHEFGLDQLTGGDGALTTLAGVAPSMPLAVNGYLVTSARGHAQEMADHDYFAHCSPIDGRCPNKMARDAGYPLPQQIPAAAPHTYWLLPDDQNEIEAIAAGYSTPLDALNGLIVDTGTNPPGHRIQLLAIGEFPGYFREVGVGYGYDASSTYQEYWSIQTGLVNESDTFLTGVVFDDANHNQIYDLGEGLGGVTVMVDATPVATNDAGGWALQVAGGDHAVSCSGGGFAGTGGATVTVSHSNRQVDCVSGFTGAYVDFAEVPEPSAPALALTALAALSAGRGLAARRRRA